jgi:hypothetical protein
VLRQESGDEERSGDPAGGDETDGEDGAGTAVVDPADEEFGEWPP